MTLSTNAVRAAFKQETDEVFIVLVTVTHPELPQPLRFSSDGVNTVSRGDTFIAFPFEIELPEQGEGLPRAKLRICNVDRQIVAAIRSLPTTPRVSALMEVVLASSPDTVETTLPAFEVTSVDYDLLVVEAELSQESFLDEPYPGDTFTPATFPGIF